MTPPGIVSFPAGVPGFEQCRRFVIETGAELGPFVGIRGVDSPHPLFLAIDPRRLDAEYTYVWSARDRLRLEAGPDTVCLVLCLVSIQPTGPLVNLRAPIVINPDTMRGVQMVPDESDAPMAHPLPEALTCW